MKLSTICFSLLLLVTLAGGAFGQASQAIYTGTLRINGEVPAGGASIQVLNESMQWVRTTHYDTASGTYGVSLFSRDGFNEGSAIVFRVLYNGDSLIARTWGAAAVYHGTSLDPPMPPEPITINLTNNHAPQFTSIPVDVAREDSAYHYQLAATDADNDSLTLSIVSAPAWLSLDANGVLHGTPGAADTGSVQITVRANDGYPQGSTTQTFTLHVLHTNHPPVVTSKPITVAYVDSVYRYHIITEDVDHDRIMFSFISLPSWLHLDTAQVLTGTPTKANEGDTIVTFDILDIWGEHGGQSFTLHVRPLNDPPGAFRRLTPRDSSVIVLPNPVVLTWSRATDPNPGDTVCYLVSVKVPQYNIDTTYYVFTDSSVTIPAFPLPPGTPPGNVTVQWTVTATDQHNAATEASNGWGEFTLQIVEGVNEGKSLPKEFGLHQNYPNPFNPTTAISFDLPQASDVHIAIYSMLGAEIRTLANGQRPAGVYTMQWDGRNNAGTQVASGLYLYRMIATGADGKVFTSVRKMTMMK